MLKVLVDKASANHRVKIGRD